MHKLSGMLLAVLFLAVANAWGACTYSSSGYSPLSAISPNRTCKIDASWGADLPLCSTFDGCSGVVIEGVGSYAGKFYYDCWINWSGRNICGGGNYGTSTATEKETRCYYQCTTEAEADSIKCRRDGGIWVSDGSFCKFSSCLQSDTLWLNDSKAACDTIGGENNYAISDIDETCVRSGICCPSDSALVGNTCKWRCDSLYTACTAKNGYLYAGVLQDTTISGADSTFTNKCYYNCSYAYNKDSTTSVTDGNTACSSPSTPIADCTRMPNDFSSVRTTYGDSVYSYDFLTPGSAAYIDSIVLTPCSRFMYRCTINGKYRYWYSDADIPTGCTNIVKIK